MRLNPAFSNYDKAKNIKRKQNEELVWSQMAAAYICTPPLSLQLPSCIIQAETRLTGSWEGADPELRRKRKNERKRWMFSRRRKENWNVSSDERQQTAGISLWVLITETRLRTIKHFQNGNAGNTRNVSVWMGSETLVLFCCSAFWQKNIDSLIMYFSSINLQNCFDCGLFFKKKKLLSGFWHSRY